jgi:selenocysteine lyase/cysteine desulfurase
LLRQPGYSGAVIASTTTRSQTVLAAPSGATGKPGRELADRLEKLQRDVIGLETCYPVVGGAPRRRIYLDSAASTLRLGVVQKVLDRYQPHYANTHSTLHYAARLSTAEYAWAHRMVLEFVGADPARWMCFFTGSGTTAGMNRVARTLRRARPGRDLVVTSIMEHHSNDLPHRRHFAEVVHVASEPSGRSLGGIDVARLRAVLEAHGPRVNYVAVTGVSNVTGYLNPIHDIAALAHRHGALIVVDAAQMIAHAPIRVSGDPDSGRDLDVLVFSGHKVYAPGSPGVVVARQDLFAGIEPEELGGGMVDTVWLDRYTVSERFPDREEAGTPNVPGAIGLAAALYALQGVGMGAIAAKERELMGYALRQLSGVPGITIYGPAHADSCALLGAIAFNLEGCDHAFTAAVLNDYFNIAVRNECFCAHPYVREMVMMSLEGAAEELSNEDLERLAERHRGMVRASFGIYSTCEDVDALVWALREIAIRREELLALYERQENGDYRHRTFAFDVAAAFSTRAAVDELLGA